MTAYKARAKGKTPKGNNKKDGATGRGSRRNNNQDEEFEALGFEMIDWNKWSYARPGKPAFRLVPGTVDFSPGWIAICDRKGLRIPIGQASPAEIKAHLDDIILEYEAELIETDWLLEGLPATRGPRVALIGAEPMGEEIDIDLWMTRPQEAARQNTRAAHEMADTHNISLRTAGEFLVERGE
jgi:hypothetical protein